jgi:hypothetical protein
MSKDAHQPSSRQDATPSPTYAARIRAELRTHCRSLMTKSKTYPLPGPDDVDLGGDTAVWWCGRTTEALGPDGAAADPADCCAPGRRCYEPPGFARS